MNALEHVQAAPAPREKPILFSGPLVRAILDGRKVQTRRPVKGGPWERVFRDAMTDHAPPPDFMALRQDGTGLVLRPPCWPGDRLWVRETFHITNAGEAVYRADYPANALARGMENIPPEDAVRWTPSIHMPRWASRITLEVTGVRVERLQAITEEDARAEGVDALHVQTGPGTLLGRPWATEFGLLWDRAYGIGAWDANPYVWAISFRRVEVEWLCSKCHGLEHRTFRRLP